jgi:hypothetical protein
MWFFKNNWKSKLRDQVDKIMTDDIEIELSDLVALVGAPSIQHIIMETVTYIVAGDIKCRFVLYDGDGKIVNECTSIFEEATRDLSDWRAVYSKA